MREVPSILCFADSKIHSISFCVIILDIVLLYSAWPKINVANRKVSILFASISGKN